MLPIVDNGAKYFKFLIYTDHNRDKINVYFL